MLFDPKSPKIAEYPSLLIDMEIEKAVEAGVPPHQAIGVVVGAIAETACKVAARMRAARPDDLTYRN